jgi:hypothetical protein
MQYQIIGNQLLLEDKIKVEFDLSIKCAIEVSDIVVVLLDVPPHKVMSENVFGISSEGNILWQIERIPEISRPGCVYKNLYERIADTLLQQLEKYPQYYGLREYACIPNTFVAGNWCGVEAIVDVNTGKVLKTFYLK